MLFNQKEDMIWLKKIEDKTVFNNRNGFLNENLKAIYKLINIENQKIEQNLLGSYLKSRNF